MNDLITTYWAGYLKNANMRTLDMTPNYIDVVILAFIGPRNDSSIDTSFLCSIYSEEQIKKWINICHKKNIKVYFSILDSPDITWDKVDLKTFAINLKQKMIEWKVDGIDIDAESSMPDKGYIENFINLATYIKKEINHYPLTYTCYTGIDGPDGSILNSIKDKIEYVQLMAYFYNYKQMIDLYNDYSMVMKDKIVIGVKAGKEDKTPLEEVIKLCIWNLKKKGIMLWTINRDTPYYTGCKSLTWAETIRDNLKDVNITNYIYYNILSLKNILPCFN